MSNKTAKIEIAMLVAVVVAVAVSAIRPHGFAVWMMEIFWVVGLLAVLLSTRRLFRFSLVAYSCFFVWMMLQTIGAHYTFELVPMDWLKEPLGLVRNPYDRIGTVLACCEAKINSNNGFSRSAMFSAPFPHRHARAALEEALEIDVGSPPAEIGDGGDGLGGA